MRILLLSGDQRRHIALAQSLRTVGEVDYIQEQPRYVRPVAHPVAWHSYFRRMREAEAQVFGTPTTAANRRVLFDTLSGMAGLTRGYDVVIVFGTSWLREPLLSELMAKQAVNVHAGISPEYRGTACNFWAEYNQQPEYVGVTLHFLDAGLDTGPILERCFWARRPEVDPWLNGMQAIANGHKQLVSLLALMRDHHLPWPTPKPQTTSHLRRYSRAADFTDDICAEYMQRWEMSHEPVS